MFDLCSLLKEVQYFIFGAQKSIRETVADNLTISEAKSTGEMEIIWWSLYQWSKAIILFRFHSTSSSVIAKGPVKFILRVKIAIYLSK